MRSENGILVDVGEVAGIVDKADVFLVGFANFSERLLVDTRSDERTRPLVRVVPSLGSYQDRIFWLGQNRPTLGMPKGFSFINWPHSPGFLEEAGIWERIRARVDATGDPLSDAACDRAIERLARLELKTMVDAIHGERHVTLWPREED